MTKELRGIIEKMVSENPDIMQIATDWSPSNIGTTIWVQFPSIEDQELANQFMEKYTDYVNDLFTPDYMYDDSHTLVFPQLERFDDDPNTPLVDNIPSVTGNGIRIRIIFAKIFNNKVW